MIRKLAAAAAFAIALSPAVLAQETPAAPKFSVAATTIGAILENAEAKAAFEKVFPEAVGNDQLQQALAMTLNDVKSFAPDYFTDEKLKAMDEELAKIQ